MRYCDTLNRFNFTAFLENKSFSATNDCLSKDFKKFTVYNKTVIQFGFCDTRKYEDHIPVSVIILAFVSTDSTYSTFIIPVILWLQTSICGQCR